MWKKNKVSLIGWFGAVLTSYLARNVNSESMRLFWKNPAHFQFMFSSKIKVT